MIGIQHVKIEGQECRIRIPEGRLYARIRTPEVAETGRLALVLLFRDSVGRVDP
jgi:hypothetical protein